MMREASIPGCPHSVMLRGRAIPRGEEGLGRGTPKEIARFAQIALGSLYELDTLLRLGSDLGYSPHDSVAKLRVELTNLAKRTSAFVRYQEGRE
jgi:four helix bundle protein